MVLRLYAPLIQEKGLWNHKEQQRFKSYTLTVESTKIYNDLFRSYIRLEVEKDLGKIKTAFGEIYPRLLRVWLFSWIIEEKNSWGNTLVCRFL